MSKVIDIRTREEKQDLPVYVVSDCQNESPSRGEELAHEIYMTMVGDLHNCINALLWKFGREKTVACLHQELLRVRSGGGPTNIGEV